MNTHSHQPAEPASSSTGLLASSSVAQGTVLTCIHGQQRSSLSIFSSILFECHLLAISQMERLRSDSPCVIAAKWCWHPAPMHAKGGGRAQKRMATCRHVAPILTEQGFFFSRHVRKPLPYTNCPRYSCSNEAHPDATLLCKQRKEFCPSEGATKEHRFIPQEAYGPSPSCYR